VQKRDHDCLTDGEWKCEIFGGRLYAVVSRGVLDMIPGYFDSDEY
jgi:hypothetical protein